MRCRIRPFVAAVVALSFFLRPTRGADTIANRSRFIHICIDKQDTWRLGLIDGQLAFLGHWHGNQDDSKLSPVPADNGQPSLIFEKDGDTLKLNVHANGQRASGVQLEKNGWYLSAKFDDGGGQVFLTKDETKYSHWEFVPAGSNAGRVVERFYLKNKNDLGKDAWLDMENSGVRYQWHKEVRKPSLSLNGRVLIGVEHPFDDGSR